MNPKQPSCSICGGGCKKDLNIEARKGVYYLVCTDCFETHRVTPLKELRKLIKKQYI